MDCKCKGVYIGKSKTMNVGMQFFNSVRRGRRFEEEGEGKENKSGIGGHVDLFSEECKIWDSVG